MKRLTFATLATLAAVMLSTTCNAQGGKFTINGTLANAEGETIYLGYGTQEKNVTDSTVIKDGKFVFSGETDRPYYTGILRIGNLNDYRNMKYVQVAVEPATITVTGDANDMQNATVTGGKTQTEQNELNATTQELRDEMKKLNAAYYATDSQEEKEKIREQMEPYSQKMNEAQKNFYKTHHDSYLSPQLLRYDMGRMTYAEIKEVYDTFTDDVKKYGDTQEIESELKALANVQPGATAPDFTTKDINGNDFTLSSLRGKVVIIDFWASWCVPCRKSNPHMRELYQKYHDRGLDMVYVSDDDSKPEAWKKAVEKDELVGEGFHHVLRGLKWDRSKGAAGIDHTNDISDKFAIHYLPTKYLIDKEGKIVCKIDEGQDAILDETLEKLLQ